jgi:endoglucanase
MTPGIWKRKYSIVFLLISLIQWSFSQVSNEIRLNQIGYYPAMPKMAVVRNASNEPFYITASSTTDTLFKGMLSEARTWIYSNESVSIADFSDFHTPGTYRIAVPGCGTTAPFQIMQRVHQNISTGALKGFYYQRASTELLPEHAGKWAHAMGHPDTHVLIHPSAATPQRPAGTIISSSGGWYDAGDYNKYIVNSGISTYTLLAAYEWFPEYCSSLTVNIPETGNGLPDILNEALWNIRWMLTMQDPNDGGVYSKCTDPKFDTFEMPWQDTQVRYVMKKTTASALDFAAVMAQTSRITARFPKLLPGFSDSCLRSALSAWTWARRNPALYYNQREINAQYPSADTVRTGEYADRNVTDEFAWAAAELFVTTAQDSFLTVANPVLEAAADVPGWPNVRTLGLYTLAKFSKKISSKVDTNTARSLLLQLADELKLTMTSSAYRVVMGHQSSNFGWGSNSVTANQGMALLVAYQLSGDSTYLHAALSNLDYLLGRNATTTCFVTGFGTHSTKHIHHRISASDGIDEPVPGLLAGGPNPFMHDKFQVTYRSSLPGLAYADDELSFASNEICINWNAPLAFLCIGMETICSPDGLPAGDVKK